MSLHQQAMLPPRHHYQALSHTLAIHDFSHNVVFGNKYAPFGSNVCGELRAYPYHHIYTGHGSGRWTLASHLYYRLLTKSGKVSLHYNNYKCYLTNAACLPIIPSKARFLLVSKVQVWIPWAMLLWCYLNPRSLPPQRFKFSHEQLHNTLVAVYEQS